MHSFEIVVVTSPKRNSLLLPHIKHLNPIVSVTPNYELPIGFDPPIKGMTHNHLGTYRCFKGHQDAIAKAKESKYGCALIFEDDAVPNISDWDTVVEDSIYLLKSFELVSFHGRQHELSAFDVYRHYTAYNMNWIKRYKDTWIVAALAYLVPREQYDKLLAFEYDGTPWDIVLYRNFKYCLMEPSCFNHDRSQGSLVD